MSETTKVKDAHPRPHARYTVRRDGNWFVATPCYGMHAPWWVPSSPTGETEPIDMRDTDEWHPLKDAVPPMTAPAPEGAR